MQARTVLLAALGGGALGGLLLGATTNTAMLPPKEQPWRLVQLEDRGHGAPASYQPVDIGPQDLSPTWYLDRMPTWKRRALEQEAAALERRYAVLTEPYEPEPLPAAEPQGAQQEPPGPAVVTIVRGSTPLDRAAEDRAPEPDLAARDAGADTGAAAAAIQPADAADSGPQT